MRKVEMIIMGAFIPYICRIIRRGDRKNGSDEVGKIRRNVIISLCVITTRVHFGEKVSKSNSLFYGRQCCFCIPRDLLVHLLAAGWLCLMIPAETPLRGSACTNGNGVICAGRVGKCRKKRRREKLWKFVNGAWGTAAHYTTILLVSGGRKVCYTERKRGREGREVLMRVRNISSSSSAISIIRV